LPVSLIKYVLNTICQPILTDGVYSNLRVMQFVLCARNQILCKQIVRGKRERQLPRRKRRKDRYVHRTLEVQPTTKNQSFPMIYLLPKSACTYLDITRRSRSNRRLGSTILFTRMFLIVNQFLSTSCAQINYRKVFVKSRPRKTHQISDILCWGRRNSFKNPKFCRSHLYYPFSR
jgi:hypothetical protein